MKFVQMPFHKEKTSLEASKISHWGNSLEGIESAFTAMNPFLFTAELNTNLTDSPSRFAGKPNLFPFYIN